MSAPTDGDGLFLIDGWTVEDLDQFKYYMASPPRELKVWEQVRIDLGSLKGASLLVGGLVLMTLGPFTNNISLAAFGAVILYWYARMLWTVTRGRSKSKLYFGLVTDLSSRHPMYPSDFLTNATCENGKIVPVVLSERLAMPIFRTHGHLQVAIAHDEIQEYGLGIGTRAPEAELPGEA